LGSEEAESPIGRYAAALALLTLGRWADARRSATSIRERDDFPRDVADALACIAAHDVVGYAEAVEAVVGSFESREAYLEDLAVDVRLETGGPARDASLALLELRRPREERRDMCVGPEAEEQEVESDAVECLVVLSRRICRLELAADAMHVGLGLQPVEQRAL